MTNEFTSPNQGATNSSAPPPIAPSPPVQDANRESELDRMILKAAILNGALEIMPHELASMAIIPLQMRLVYQVGQTYGYSLDRGHIKDFLATAGIGLTSQVVEEFTERIVGEFARRFAGGMLGGMVGQASGSAVAFASTYAIGHLARHYYASGRNLSAAQLKDVFASMLNSGRNLQSQYANDIARCSREVNLADLLPLTKQP